MSSDTDMSREATPSPQDTLAKSSSIPNKAASEIASAASATIADTGDSAKDTNQRTTAAVDPEETKELAKDGDTSSTAPNNINVNSKDIEDEGHTQKKDISSQDSQGMTSARRPSPQPMETENRASESPAEDAVSRKNSPVPGKLVESKGHPERKRRASTESGDSAMTKTSEGKEDDDDDENDDDEKMPVGQDIDPERLKAFNMFVRLFVDENLDRMVPISKQPKDKIQAILEACDRQFPEFHERSRKRIRTYLKSCRRMRRSKEHNGWEPLRPTPPHLTSAAAEGLLATACENESQNAKRMRMGLEPLPATAMMAHAAIMTSQSPPSAPASANQQQAVQPQAAAASQSITPQPATISNTNNNNNCSSNNNNNNNTNNNNSLPSPRSINCSVPTGTDFLRHTAPPPAFRPAPDFTPPFFTNGHGAAAAAALFRPGFPGYQHPAHHHPSVLSHAQITANNGPANGEFGPTDLSMKKSNSKGQLSPSEVTAIKQLIAGYKESASFLYRSADELEQLLLQQN